MVVGVIVLILGLSVPALSVWDARKREDAINLTVGLLQRVRTTAMTEKRVVGFFCYVRPEDQAQYLWPIEPQLDSVSDPTSATVTEDRFVLRDVEPFMLPLPMRLAPIAVACLDLEVHLQWTPEQLASNEYRDPADDGILPYTPNNGPDGAGTQYHRNFFVILFDRNGQVLRDRRAFIVDRDVTDYPPADLVDNRCGGQPSEHPGYRTGLAVTAPFDPVQGLHNAVVDNRCPPQPIHFGSADGVLIYDDDAFRQAITNYDPFSEPELPRDFLKQQSLPLYIQVQTGRVIAGEPEGPST